MNGIKGVEWEYLLNSALDTVEEFEHVALAVFPCGSCLFELPTTKPELVCIYAEHVDYLLDPSKQDNCPTFVDTTNNSKIYFKSLYSLVSDLASFSDPFSGVPLGIVCPYICEALFEEEIFLPAKNKYADIVKKHYFINVPARNLDSWTPYGRKEHINYLLYRTELIYSKTGVFVTNHLGYDISDMIDKYVADLDRKVIEKIYLNVHNYQEIDSAFRLLSKYMSNKKKDYSNYIKETEDLGAIVKDFYKMEL